MIPNYVPAGNCEYSQIVKRRPDDSGRFQLFWKLSVVVTFVLVILCLGICIFKCYASIFKSNPCSTGYTFFKDPESDSELNSTFESNSNLGSCYKPHPSPQNFTAARDQCIKDSADLLSLHSQSENDFVIKLYRLALNDSIHQLTPIWLGLTYNFTDKTWNWVDKSEFDFENWALGVPNWLDTSQDYWAHIEVRKPADFFNKWDNIGLKNHRSFVCKKAANF